MPQTSLYRVNGWTGGRVDGWTQFEDNTLAYCGNRTGNNDAEFSSQLTSDSFGGKATEFATEETGKITNNEDLERRGEARHCKASYQSRLP